MKRLKVLFVCILMLVLGACSKSELTWQEQYDLGMKYLTEGNYEKAILFFTAAIEIDNKLPMAYVGRADAYMGSAGLLDTETAWDEMLDFYLDAEADYLAALDLDEFIIEVYYKLADVYIAMGEEQKAEDILRKGYEITGDEGMNGRPRLESQAAMQGQFKSTTVTAFDAEDNHCGTFTYAYDDQGRMVVSMATDEKNELMSYETWTYDDANNQTIVNRQQTFNDSPTHEMVVETLEGCDGEGNMWYLIECGENTVIMVDPERDAVNGRVDLKERGYAVYGYDSRNNVNRIDTYDVGGQFVGYCVVSMVY